MTEFKNFAKGILQMSRQIVSPPSRQIPAYSVVRAVEAALGEREAAFESLEQAYAERDIQLQFLKVEPGYDPLRDDPRFNEMLRRMNLPE